jgi:hypothetical protein
VEDAIHWSPPGYSAGPSSLHPVHLRLLLQL